MKIDLTDMTFLIPIRIDSVVRLENLMLSVEFLQRHFETNVKIMECDKYNNHIVERLLQNVQYLFMEDDDNIYYRTKYINMLVEDVETPYISIWDADIIANPSLMMEAVRQLRESNAEVAYPYNGKMLDTSIILRKLYMKNRDITFLHRNAERMNILYKRTDLVGGAIFYNREAYIKGGKDDEHFYGWGNEDFERELRWKTLGYRRFRADGHLYHLSHPRGENSQYKSLYNSTYSISLVLSARQSSKKDLRFTY